MTGCWLFNGAPLSVDFCPVPNMLSPKKPIIATNRTMTTAIVIAFGFLALGCCLLGRLTGFFPIIDYSHTNILYERSQLSRSEEHTSELQSHSDLVCRLLL